MVVIHVLFHLTRPACISDTIQCFRNHYVPHHVVVNVGPRKNCQDISRIPCVISGVFLYQKVIYVL